MCVYVHMIHVQRMYAVYMYSTCTHVHVSLSVHSPRSSPPLLGLLLHNNNNNNNKHHNNRNHNKHHHNNNNNNNNSFSSKHNSPSSSSHQGACWADNLPPLLPWRCSREVMQLAVSRGLPLSPLLPVSSLSRCPSLPSNTPLPYNHNNNNNKHHNKQHNNNNNNNSPSSSQHKYCHQSQTPAPCSPRQIPPSLPSQGETRCTTNPWPRVQFLPQEPPGVP